LKIQIVRLIKASLLLKIQKRQYLQHNHKSKNHSKKA